MSKVQFRQVCLRFQRNISIGKELRPGDFMNYEDTPVSGEELDDIDEEIFNSFSETQDFHQHVNNDSTVIIKEEKTISSADANADKLIIDQNDEINEEIFKSSKAMRLQKQKTCIHMLARNLLKSINKRRKSLLTKVLIKLSMTRLKN